MEPEGLLPFSQDPATGPYPEPDASSPYSPTYFPKIHSNIILPSRPNSSEWSVLFKFSEKNLVTLSQGEQPVI
jgi:hypothetical protein